MEQLNSESVTYTRESNKLLPIANIARIMRKYLPSNAKVAKEARDVIQESCSEFILFIATCDRVKEEKRKTITGEDVLDSMQGLGFDEFLPSLEAYLGKYRARTTGVKKVAKTATVSAPSKASKSKAPPVHVVPPPATSDATKTANAYAALQAIMTPTQTAALIAHLQSLPQTPQSIEQIAQLKLIHTHLSTVAAAATCETTAPITSTPSANSITLASPTDIISTTALPTTTNN